MLSGAAGATPASSGDGDTERLLSCSGSGATRWWRPIQASWARPQKQGSAWVERCQGISHYRPRADRRHDSRGVWGEQHDSARPPHQLLKGSNYTQIKMGKQRPDFSDAHNLCCSHKSWPIFLFIPPGVRRERKPSKVVKIIIARSRFWAALMLNTILNFDQGEKKKKPWYLNIKCQNMKQI